MMDMENPYESPTARDDASPVREPYSTASQPAAATSYVVAVVIGCVLCWLAFLHGLHLTFKDLFGGPPPPETNFFFAMAGLAGVAVEIVGLVYFVRKQSFDIDSFGAVCISFGMVANLLAISLISLPRLRVLMR